MLAPPTILPFACLETRCQLPMRGDWYSLPLSRAILVVFSHLLLDTLTNFVLCPLGLACNSQIRYLLLPFFYSCPSRHSLLTASARKLSTHYCLPGPYWFHVALLLSRVECQPVLLASTCYSNVPSVPITPAVYKA